MISVEELSKLQRIAEDEGVPTAQVLRRLIKSDYQRKFGTEKPRITAPTLRGLLDDVTGRASLTAGNIAERMGIPLDDVLRGLKVLEKKGILQYGATFGHGSHPRNSVWHRGPQIEKNEDVYVAAEKARLDLDEPLFEAEE